MIDKTSREIKIENMAKNKQPLVVILEDIHDPHNAAAVWRNCDAFGIQKVFLIFNKEVEFDPKIVGKESSSSANKWLNFEIFHGTKECLDKIKEQGYRIYATVLDEKAKDFSSPDFRFEEKAAIMLGNEHAGLSETAIKLADEKIYIPMMGMVQSLNLSVTAGICLFEYTRQRKIAL